MIFFARIKKYTKRNDDLSLDEFVVMCRELWENLWDFWLRTIMRNCAHKIVEFIISQKCKGSWKWYLEHLEKNANKLNAGKVYEIFMILMSLFWVKIIFFCVCENDEVWRLCGNLWKSIFNLLGFCFVVRNFKVIWNHILDMFRNDCGQFEVIWVNPRV